MIHKLLARYRAVTVLLCGCLLFVASSPAQQPASADTATELLDRLAGHWVMTGRLGDKSVTHDIDAKWVLNREYLRLHEVSGEKDASGAPKYEAIIFFSFDPKTSEYLCLWLDNTDGGGLSVPIARGKKAGDAIPLVFILHGREALHTTFTYSKGTDTWQITIDDVTGSKPERFGDVQLTRTKTG